MPHQQPASSRDGSPTTPRGVPRDHPIFPTPLPTLTLLTWDEYQEFSQDVNVDDDGASAELLLATVSDENGGFTTDESDDEDFAADMNDDDMVPVSLWKATCVPTFAVETQQPDDYVPRPVMPSVPSTSLETCINTPTFALVPTHSYKAGSSVWRDLPAPVAAVSQNSAPPGVAAPASSKLARNPSSVKRTISQPAPTHHAQPQAVHTPARAQSPKRKRQSKASSAEQVGAAAHSLCAAGKRAQVAKKQKHGAQHPRNPLQPKVPNAVAPEVMRSVTA